MKTKIFFSTDPRMYDAVKSAQYYIDKIEAAGGEIMQVNFMLSKNDAGNIYYHSTVVAKVPENLGLN